MNRGALATLSDSIYQALCAFGMPPEIHNPSHVDAWVCRAVSRCPTYLMLTLSDLYACSDAILADRWRAALVHYVNGEKHRTKARELHPEPELQTILDVLVHNGFNLLTESLTTRLVRPEDVK